MYPNLRLQLWRKKIRQNQLAKLLQIDESMLSRMLNGFRQPGPEIRHRIAGLLESNEEWLFAIENVTQAECATAPVAATTTRSTPSGGASNDRAE